MSTSCKMVLNSNICNAKRLPPEDFKAGILFQALEFAMQDDTDNLIEKARGVFACRVKNGPGGAEGYWVVDARTGKGTVEYFGKTKPEITFTINDADVTDLLTGKLDAQRAFFQGKIKLQGNMALAMRLLDVQRKAKGRIEEFRSKL